MGSVQVPARKEEITEISCTWVSQSAIPQEKRQWKSSSYHRLLRPLVLIAKCSLALLGVIRESPWEEGLELFGGDVISLCLPGESIYQLPL